MTMTKVEIRPLPIKKWHGKKGKEAFAQPLVIEVLYDETTGGYATGLTKEEQELYEEKTKLNLSPNFNANEPHPYWSTKAAQLKLPNHTIILDPNKDIEFIKIKNLKASRFVANSIKEWQEGLFPEATHVIFDEQEEVDDKASKVQLKNKAIALTVKMSFEQKVDLLQILSTKNLKKRSPNFLDVEIDEMITQDAAKFIKYATMDKKDINVRANVLRAIAENILTKEGSQILYMGNTIAMDYEEAVKWFKSPQNSKLKVAILEKLTD